LILSDIYQTHSSLLKLLWHNRPCASRVPATSRSVKTKNNHSLHRNSRHHYRQHNRALYRPDEWYTNGSNPFWQTQWQSR